MSSLSDIIEEFLKDLIEQNDNDIIEIQRNILAQQFDCAPSQINYVLTTRFNNDRGYIVESRRGGGGYVKIIKVGQSKDEHLENIVNSTIGNSISVNRARDVLQVLEDKKIINLREFQILNSALSDRTLNNVYCENRNIIRADILKNMLLVILHE